MPQIDAIMEGREPPPPMGWSPGGPAREEPKPFADRRARRADLSRADPDGHKGRLRPSFCLSGAIRRKIPDTGAVR